MIIYLYTFLLIPTLYLKVMGSSKLLPFYYYCTHFNFVQARNCDLLRQLCKIVRPTILSDWMRANVADV